MGTTDIHPILFYRDAPAALQWLQDAFGFEELFRVPDEAGGITHSEMRLGDAIIMVSSSVPDRGYVSPKQIDGRGTMHLNVYVPDPDAQHARAVAAGASVVWPLEDKAYGGRGFTCTDPEGHSWSFGSYRPGTAP